MPYIGNSSMTKVLNIAMLDIEALKIAVLYGGYNDIRYSSVEFGGWYVAFGGLQGGLLP